MKANIKFRKSDSAFISKEAILLYTKLRKPEEGQTFQTMDGLSYVWHNDELLPLKIQADSKINLYDLNKSAISQLPPLTNEEILNKEEIIGAFHMEKKNNFYLLYGKEISYFTLFNIKDNSDLMPFGLEVMDCLVNIGIIKSVELAEDKNSIEIWIENDGGPTVLYLFPYDSGIVEARG